MLGRMMHYHPYDTSILMTDTAPRNIICVGQGDVLFSGLCVMFWLMCCAVFWIMCNVFWIMYDDLDYVFRCGVFWIIHDIANSKIHMFSFSYTKLEMTTFPMMKMLSFS